MGDNLLSVMFPLHALDHLSKTKKESSVQPLKNNMVLFGEANSIYRTSLLFQACLSVSSTKREAIFITKNKFNILPMSVHNMPRPDSELLKFIKFKYFYKLEQLIEFFSKVIFEKSSPPAIIIVDDIVSFIDASKIENELDCVRLIAMTCAHAKHVFNHLNTKCESSMIVSCRNLEKDNYFRLYFDTFAYLKTIKKDQVYQVDLTEKENNIETKLSFKVENSSLHLDSFRIEESYLK